MAASSCLGCSIDHPSQEQHLDGCLTSPEGAGMMHGDEIDVNQSTIELMLK